MSDINKDVVGLYIYFKVFFKILPTIIVRLLNYIYTCDKQMSAAL